MRGIRNRHLQAMLPRLIRRKVKFNAHWQRLELPAAILSIWHGAKNRNRQSASRGWWSSRSGRQPEQPYAHEAD